MPGVETHTAIIVFVMTPASSMVKATTWAPLIVSRSKWREPDLAHHDTYKQRKNAASFSTMTGLLTCFSLRLGDPVWRGKNVLDFGGSVGSILLERELESGNITVAKMKEAAT
jgi:hypothetical protein